MNDTWNSQIVIPDKQGLFAALRAAGLPLAAADDDDAESDSCSIVCVAEVRRDLVHALVATPTGHLYRFEPDFFDTWFWAFAANNYYMVTGNGADRDQMAVLTGVSLKSIKGRALARKGDTISGLSLDDLLAKLGYATRQQDPQIIPSPVNATQTAMPTQQIGLF